MTEQEAIDLLKHHSYSGEDGDNRSPENGFIGMLRPFNGTLDPDNFNEIMDCMETLSGALKSSLVAKEVISSLWAICHFTRQWALDPGGMLRRNNLLSDDQVALLWKWEEEISGKVLWLLEDTNDSLEIDD